MRRRPHRTLLLALVFLSGAASLIYQVLWSRQLTLVLGSTTFAVSAVVTAFMIGLALGARYFGPRADRSQRPLRLYVALELGIAGSALLLPAAIRALSTINPVVNAWTAEQPFIIRTSERQLPFYAAVRRERAAHPPALGP